MAPVTGRVADREQDWLVFPFCFVERVGAPGVPVHWVMRVLQQVGAGLTREAVRHGVYCRMRDDDLPWDATPFLPEQITLESLRAAAADCEGCDLYRTGTQTVFGEGSSRSDVMFIGEQPVDQEDRSGQPFVGPAGRVLDEALEEVGIERDNVYVTNVVKHFKFVARGKRRIHSKPNAREV